MRKIDSLLADYGANHQHTTNKTIHWFCVPAIFFSVVGLIYSIPPGPLASLDFLLSNFTNWATIVLLLVFFYYVSLSPPLALGMLLFAALCLAAASLFTLFLPFLCGFSAGYFLWWHGFFNFMVIKLKVENHLFLKTFSFC